MSHVTKEDLIKYGVNAQFAGRFDILVSLKTLEVDELKEILLFSQASCIHSMNALLQKSVGVSVTIDKECAEVIAKKAIKEKTGARGLSAKIYEIIQDKLFDIGGQKISGQIKLTMVDEHPAATFIKKDLVEKVEGNQNCLITAKDNLKSMERYVDHLLEIPKATNIYCSMREVRAVHILVSSVILYLLAECNNSDQTILSVIRLMRLMDIYEVLIAKLKENSLPTTLYKKAKSLSITSRGIQFAISALEGFRTNPQYQ